MSLHQQNESTSPRFLLVDGHSVIHSWPGLRALHMRSAKRYLAREELLKQMRLLQDVTGERVVVVFDGASSKVHEERESGLQVFFSDGSISADGIIERLAAKYSHQYQLRVCTADGMIEETVHALGAAWLSPQMLSHEVERALAELTQRLKGGMRR